MQTCIDEANQLTQYANTMSTWNIDISKYRIFNKFLNGIITETIPVLINGYDTLIPQLQNIGAETKPVTEKKNHLIYNVDLIKQTVPTLEAAQLERIRDIHEVQNNLAVTRNRLLGFANDARASCDAFQKYFIWLKNAHTELQTKISSHQNNDKELKETLQGSLERFHTVNKVMGRGNMKKFDGGDLVQGYAAKWDETAKSFKTQINELRKEVDDWVYIATRRSKKPSVVSTEETRILEVLNRIEKHFMKLKVENIAAYKMDVAIIRNTRLPSFLPSAMPDMEVLHFMLLLLAEKEADNTMKYFNELMRA